MNKQTGKQSFQALFKPAIVLNNRLSFIRKFGLIGIVILIPIAFICSQLFINLNKDLQFTGHTKKGLELLEPVKTMLLHVQQHRGASARFLFGDDSFKAQTDASEADIAADIAKLDAMDAAYGADMGTSELWDKVKRMWESLKVENANELIKVNFARHDPMLKELLSLMKEIVKKYGLMLDSELDTYYLMNTAVQEMPQLTETIGQSRALGMAITERKVISPTESAQMIALHGSIESGFAAITGDLNQAIELNGQIKGELAEDFATVNQTVTDYLMLLQSEFVSAVSIALPHVEFFDHATAAIEKMNALYDKSFTLYSDLIDEQRDSVTLNRNLIVVLLVIGLIAMVYLSMAFYYSVMTAVNSLERGSKELASGDLTVRVHLATRDELHKVGDSFNEMADSFSQMIRLNRNLSDHLAASSEELQAISGESAKTGSHLAQSVQQIAEGAEAQTKTAEEIARAMEEMATGVGRIAESSSVVSEASTDAERQAAQGKLAVEEAANQMDQIHRSIEGLSSVINLLNEHSHKIGGIGNIILDIANQTNLLSLNASIEAARAGEHGKGFSVVAVEVKKLADQTKQSTTNIQELVAAIRQSAGQAVEAMNESAQDVNRGLNAIRSVDEVFVRILASVENVAEKTQDISASSEQMSAGTQQVKASMDETVGISRGVSGSAQNIAAITQEQLASMEEVASSAESLGKIVQELQEEIGKFKL